MPLVVQGYRNNYLKRVAINATDEIALVLASMHKSCIDNHAKSGYLGISKDEIAAITKINKSTITVILHMLQFPIFVVQKKHGHTLFYRLTKDGWYLYKLMTDEKKFPGRAAKIKLILNTLQDGSETPTAN